MSRRMLALLSASVAVAALTTSPALPSGVETDENVSTIVSGYADQCIALGGTLAAGADYPWTMTADLDGDGRQDYVLNTQNLQCSGSATAFCGNGGCQIDIALSSQDFSDPVSALGGQPTLVQSETGTALQIWVDGSSCDLTDDSDQQCWVTYEWSGGAIKSSYARYLPQ